MPWRATSSPQGVSGDFEPEDKPDQPLAIFFGNRCELTTHQPPRPPEEFSHIFGAALRPDRETAIGDVEEDLKGLAFHQRRDFAEQNADAAAANVLGHTMIGMLLDGEVGVEAGIA